MSKDRNTLAKRQRESAKRRRAAEKLERKRRGKAEATSTSELQGDALGNIASRFSQSELRVFAHFHRYLMTPGGMLCLSAQEIESMDAGLHELVEKQMLLSEGVRGAYCLTPDGFRIMKDLASRCVL